MSIAQKTWIIVVLAAVALSVYYLRPILTPFLARDRKSVV